MNDTVKLFVVGLSLEFSLLFEEVTSSFIDFKVCLFPTPLLGMWVDACRYPWEVWQKSQPFGTKRSLARAPVGIPQAIYKVRAKALCYHVYAHHMHISDVFSPIGNCQNWAEISVKRFGSNVLTVSVYHKRYGLVFHNIIIYGSRILDAERNG